MTVHTVVSDRWRIACNGDNKRYPWFVTRGQGASAEYVQSAGVGNHVRRFATPEAAQRVADERNATAEMLATREHVRSALVALRAILNRQETLTGNPLVGVLADLENIALRLNGPAGPPSNAEIYRAMDVLGATERYSVYDNEAPGSDGWVC